MGKSKYVNLATLLCLGFSFFILINCNSKEINNNDSLLLMGESDNWNLDGYKFEITLEGFKAGNGTVSMKAKNEYITDFFQFKTHAVIFNKDETIHAGYVAGEGINIAEKTIGIIEVGKILDEAGVPATLEDVSEIYMIIEWGDTSKNKDVEERIDLYKKP